MKPCRFVFGVALLLFGCGGHADVLSANLDGANVSVRLSSVKKATSGGAFVYGRVEIKGDHPLEAVDLNCIGLALGELHSKKTYVDSVTSVLAERFPAKNGLIVTKLYWFFPGLESKHVDLRHAKISLNASAESCIDYK